MRSMLWTICVMAWLSLRPGPRTQVGPVSGWFAPAAGSAGCVVRDRSSNATGGHGAELEPVESGDVRRRAPVEATCSQKPSADARIHGRAPAFATLGSTTVLAVPEIDDSLASSANRRQSGLECEALAA
jgi:hypothetical protein